MSDTDPKSVEELVALINERLGKIEADFERARAESNPNAKFGDDDHYLKHPAMENGYNDSANAVRDVTVAAFSLMARELGITGFQASWAALNAYAIIMDIDSPFGVYRLQDALYPQYDLSGRLREWLGSDENVKWLGDQAEAKLAEHREIPASEHVEEHWKMLVQQRDAMLSRQTGVTQRTDIPE